MYGKCGPNPDADYHMLNCVYNGPAKQLDADSLHTLEFYCPEMLAEFGGELCCDQEQVLDLVQNLALPANLIGSCPGCYYNFRQSFCNLACSPKQSDFLNVTDTRLNEDSKFRLYQLRIF